MSADLKQNLEDVTDRVQKLLDIRLSLEDQSSYISDQLIAHANSAATAGYAWDNGRTLDRVVQLVFEKAIESCPNGIWRYADLCMKLMKETSKHVQLKEPPPLYDPGPNRGPILAGPRLFSALLLSRCRAAFDAGPERLGVSCQEVVRRDRSGKRISIKPSSYKVWMATRRWCGLMRFIGELWRVEIIAEEIVVACGDKLVEKAEKDEVDGVQALGVFLMTSGKRLEGQQTDFIDDWIDRMKKINEKPREQPREDLMLIVSPHLISLYVGHLPTP